MGVDDGGAAYPRENYQDETPRGQFGMTLLDYFAGQVAEGMIQSSTFEGYVVDPGVIARHRSGMFAEIAYGIAAAMIAEKRRRES